MMEKLATFWNAAKTLWNGFWRLDAAVACATTWDRSRQLGLAIENNFAWGARLAIWRGASLSQPTARFSDLTPLGKAMDMERWGIAFQLLRVGADPEMDSTSPIKDIAHPPLARALEAGQEHLAYELIQRGADINRRNSLCRTYLEGAIGNGKPDIIRFLLANGADPFDRTGPWKRSALTAAAHTGDPAIVAPFLAAGYSSDHEIDGDHKTMISVAARYDRDALAALLIARGASLSRQANSTDDTPLMVAAEHDKATVCRRIAVHGGKALLDFTNKEGKTALHLAIGKKAKHTPIILLEAGAEVNVRDTTNGDTPLMVAVQKKNVDAVRLLLQYGADKSIANKFGCAPAGICQDDEILKMLQTASSAPCDNARIVRSIVRRLGRLRPPAPSL